MFSKAQKIIIIGLLISAFAGCVYSVVIVATQSIKEIQSNYFHGIVVDKGEEHGRSSYRWLIADWTTADGNHIGRREINAGGQPINRISVGDTIYANGDRFLAGFFWWPVSGGGAYYPTQISTALFILTLLFQTGLWLLVIYGILCGWKLLGKIKN